MQGSQVGQHEREGGHDVGTGCSPFHGWCGMVILAMLRGDIAGSLNLYLLFQFLSLGQCSILHRSTHCHPSFLPALLLSGLLLLFVPLPLLSAVPLSVHPSILFPFISSSVHSSTHCLPTLHHLSIFPAICPSIHPLCCGYLHSANV